MAAYSIWGLRMAGAGLWLVDEVKVHPGADVAAAWPVAVVVGYRVVVVPRTPIVRVTQVALLILARVIAPSDRAPPKALSVGIVHRLRSWGLRGRLSLICVVLQCLPAAGVGVACHPLVGA